jgi:uncharacterized protein YbbC (DUF1343 family)
MLGATGELGVLSIGVGTDAPFLRVGSNLIKGDTLTSVVSAAYLPPFGTHAENFEATTSAGTKTYDGVRIELPHNLNALPSLYEGQYQMLSSMMQRPAFRSAIDQLPGSTNTMYQKVTGMYGLLDKLKSCATVTSIVEGWHRDVAAFRKDRAPYLLYK